MRAFEVKYVPNNELKSILKENFYFYRPVVPGCTGCAVAHPDFGRSVNPIPTRGKILPTLYYCHPQFFSPPVIPG